jgi:hypothetical protein
LDIDRAIDLQSLRRVCKLRCTVLLIVRPDQLTKYLREPLERPVCSIPLMPPGKASFTIGLDPDMYIEEAAEHVRLKEQETLDDDDHRLFSEKFACPILPHHLTPKAP